MFTMLLYDPHMNHAPIKYRGLIKKMSHFINPIYLIGSLYLATLPSLKKATC